MKKWLTRNRMPDRRRGQGMVEFAMAIPIFLMLVLGVIEFGRMFFMYTSVFAAAREGARYGAAVKTLCDPVGLQNAARRVGFFAGDMDIAIQYDDGYGTIKACENTVLGDRVHVTASIRFQSITGVIPDLTLRSTARRTIIKRAFLEWTLAPTSANAGGVPPTPVPGGSSGGTNTPTPTKTNTPLPGATATNTGTPTNTPTITNTPEPPVCSSESWTVGMTTTTEYYDLKITNNTGYINQLTQVSISWNTSGNRNLVRIEFQPVGGNFITKWTGPDTDGYLLWYPDPFLQLNPGVSYLRFVFEKSNITINNITLNISYPNGYSCQLNYP
jgi:hypothetical protein